MIANHCPLLGSTPFLMHPVGDALDTNYFRLGNRFPKDGYRDEECAPGILLISHILEIWSAVADVEPEIDALALRFEPCAVGALLFAPGGQFKAFCRAFNLDIRGAAAAHSQHVWTAFKSGRSSWPALIGAVVKAVGRQRVVGVLGVLVLAAASAFLLGRAFDRRFIWSPRVPCHC